MDVRRISRADAAKAVGRRGGDAAHSVTPAAGLRICTQELKRQWMRRNTHTDCFLPASYRQRRFWSAFENQG